MSCPIHDRCTCSASLQYTASISTTGSSQFPPQFFSYDWAAPHVATSGGPWHSVDPVTFYPPSTSYSGHDLSQPEYYLPGNTYETIPLHLMYQRESRVHAQEQKQALPSGELPQHPIPYVPRIGRMGMPSNFSGVTLPVPHLHRASTSSFAGHEEFSQGVPATDSDQRLFDEPPPPYNSQAVHPLVNVFPLSAVSPADRLLNLGPIASSPLAPVPLRHSSLYQVLQHESPASPLTGALQSRASSLAHALEDPQARQAPLPCTPALGDRLGSYGILAPSPNATQLTSAPLILAGDPRSTLVQVPATPAPAQVQAALVSSEMPPTTRASAHKLSLVTPSHPHTLAHPFSEVATHDYDTLPRLRKLQPALPGSSKEDHSVASSPLSSVSSRPSSSTGIPTASSSDSKSALESAFTLPMLGRKRPVLRAKLACLFCRRRKIQCRPSSGDREDNACQQCAKRCRECEYPEMTWRGRGRKRSRSDDLEESDYEEDSLPLVKTRRQT